jgi:hypothetical protein
LQLPLCLISVRSGANDQQNFPGLDRHGESGDCEVATDEAIAIDRWKSEFGEGFDGAGVCRIVKLNVTISEPTGKNGPDTAVDVVVPGGAGRTEEVETE